MSENNNNTWSRKIIAVNVDGIDPQMLDFLPPEIRDILAREANGGTPNPTTTPAEDIEEPVKKPKFKFDFDMTNCNQDLKVLTEKLKNAKDTGYGMLLYGISGSGKSYYGQYLAQELGMPLLKKRASDLIDKFVGQTERNIKKAFQEAKEKKAILLLDEADSFLFDRRYSRQDFQAASVNEMLTQMEDHPYPFIMTTNLKDKIDNASMRRFIFKIKFDYMGEKNVNAGVKTYFGKKFRLTPEQTKDFTHLCAGDFKVAKRKLEILENGKFTNDLIYEYLLQEQKEKDIQTSTTMSI